VADFPDVRLRTADLEVERSGGAPYRSSPVRATCWRAPGHAILTAAGLLRRNLKATSRDARANPDESGWLGAKAVAGRFESAGFLKN